MPLAENRLSKDSVIYIVDIGDSDRVAIASMLGEICRRGASVVGVKILFENWNSDSADTLLAKAIYSCNKIVLLSGTDENSKWLHSHPNFTNAASGEGGHYFLHQQGIVEEYVPILQKPDGQIFNFSHVIASFYSKTPERFFDGLKVNKSRNLLIEKGLDKFNVIAGTDVFLNEFDGKIVLLSDIQSENLIRVVNSEKDTIVVPEILIDANIILEFINNR